MHPKTQKYGPQFSSQLQCTTLPNTKEERKNPTILTSVITVINEVISNGNATLQEEKTHQLMKFLLELKDLQEFQ